MSILVHNCIDRQEKDNVQNENFFVWGHEWNDFYTENNLDMQVASFNLKKGENIDRHYHYKQNRNIQTTSEVIYVQEGNLEIEIYDNEKNFVDKLSASEGMIIIIFDGGHAINIIEDSKFIEIKQGPYDPENDKERF